MGIDWRDTDLNHCLQVCICLILLNEGDILDILLHVLGDRLWRCLHGGDGGGGCVRNPLLLSVSALRSTPVELATKNARVSQRRNFPFQEELT